MIYGLVYIIIFEQKYLSIRYSAYEDRCGDRKINWEMTTGGEISETKTGSYSKSIVCYYSVKNI